MYHRASILKKEVDMVVASKIASPTLPLPPPVVNGLEHLAATRPQEVTHRVERRTPPELATLITVQVKPQSVCYLYHPKAPERRIQIDADNRGIVRFRAKAMKGAEPTTFHLECHHAKHAELHAITLISDVHYTPAMSSPELSSAPVVAGEPRPPLPGDPLALSNAELVARGYPPRPDPKRSPARYSRWLKNVSRPLTKIDTRLVAHPDYTRSKRGPAGEGTNVKHARTLPSSQANSNSANWTGAYFTNPVGQFFSVQAEWYTPIVFALSNGPPFSAVVEWIGLDNAAGDLYQAGTGSECYNIFFWEITTYFMWMETLPWSWWVVPNFPVSPGDLISVDIWVANQFGETSYQEGDWGGLTPQDNSVWFYLINSTNGASFMGTYPTAPQSLGGQTSTGFTGTTAEFILERPTINGGYTELAWFLPTTMTNCGYGDSQYGDRVLFPVEVEGGPQPFDAKLAYLNMIDPSNGNTLLATPLTVPDPNTEDAQAILFFWINYQ
jgi:Peptidase A4 family